MKKNIAYIAFVALSLIWGANFLFMKWALEWISPLQAVFLRVLFGFVPIAVFALLRRELKWAHLRHAHHFLVMSVMATSFYYWAYAKATVLLDTGVAGLLSGMIPLCSFFAAWLFLRSEPVNLRTASGIALSLVGILIIAQPWQGLQNGISIQGVLYMMIGSLSLGASFVYAKRYISPLGLSPVALCTYQIGLALVLLAVVTDLHGIGNIRQSPVAFSGLAIGLGLSGTGIAYILYYFVVERLGAVIASAATYPPAVISLVLGCLVNGETLQPAHIVAMCAILGGVFVLQTGRNIAKPVTAPGLAAAAK